MSDHGFIPLGKYSSARDSILHYLCTSDWANDSTGNSEAPTGYFWRISNTVNDVAMTNTEFSSIMEEWLTENSEVTDSVALRAELVGHFLVMVNDQGFVYVWELPSEESLLAQYEELENEFYKWESQDDEGEL